MIEQNAPSGKNGADFSLAGQTLKIELAQTEAERRQGLSGRASLPEDSGMLFVFDAPTYPGFWMKDMNFPLDVIWLDENWQVVGITANVLPDSFPQAFYPPQGKLIKYVLELNAGWADTHNLKLEERLQRA